MINEIIIETGIVLSSEKGFAEVLLSETESCEECSAKIICKPKDISSRVIKVVDPFGCSPGNEVRISVQGNLILKSSIKLYGLPLIIFVTIMIVCLMFLGTGANSELISFLTASFSTVTYYILLNNFERNRIKNLMPRIISSRKH